MKKVKQKFKIAIANGVNLDLLGQREPQIYGRLTLSDIKKDLQTYLKKQKLEGRVELTFMQTNSERKYLEFLDHGWDACILNPGAWTHTSLALADRIRALQLSFIEVHISNTSARETYRKNSFIAELAIGRIEGLGTLGYTLALTFFVENFLFKTQTSKPQNPKAQAIEGKRKATKK